MKTELVFNRAINEFGRRIWYNSLEGTKEIYFEDLLEKMKKVEQKSETRKILRNIGLLKNVVNDGHHMSLDLDKLGQMNAAYVGKDLFRALGIHFNFQYILELI